MGAASCQFLWHSKIGRSWQVALKFLLLFHDPFCTPPVCVGVCGCGCGCGGLDRALAPHSQLQLIPQAFSSVQCLGIPRRVPSCPAGSEQGMNQRAGVVTLGPAVRPGPGRQLRGLPISPSLRQTNLWALGPGTYEEPRFPGSWDNLRAHLPVSQRRWVGLREPGSQT